MKRFVAIMLVLMTLASMSIALADVTPTYSLGERVLSKGMTGSDVKQAQERLIFYLYYKGVASGTFNNATMLAVKEFQKRNNLTVNGKVDEATANLLKGSSAKYANDPMAPDYVLKAGDKGEAVEILQKNLRDTYYYKGNITGKYDTNTVNAVKNFQRSVGITVDGKAGKNTKALLYNRSAAIFKGGLPLRDLKQGDRGYDVYVVQKRLRTLHYLTNAANGNYNANTVTAMKKFEKNNGLKQTGNFYDTTRRYLYPSKVDARAEKEWHSKDTKYDEYVPPTLRLYSRGANVSIAQMKLKAAGYLLDKCDGYFGKSTRAAVIAVQKDYGIDPDGVIGAETWGVLRSFNIENADPKVVDISRYGTTPAKLLKYGSTGANVVQLQKNLKTLGYNPGNADGIFGKKTRLAVIEFQSDNGLVKDGIVGTKTIVAMNEALGIQWK